MKKTYPLNQRRYFADIVYKKMLKNKNIWVITGDLGYKMWDKIKKKFPERFLNTGAAEQSMLDIAVGLALEGKIPIVYSITTFLLYRPFETIRNYINNEKIPVKLIGSGRDRDYTHDGFSHWAQEDKKVLNLFKNIRAYWPNSTKEIPNLVNKMLSNKKPYYINLSR